MKRAVVLLAFLLTGATVWAAPIEVIAPGERIGPVRLGMSLDDAERVLRRYGRVERFSPPGLNTVAVFRRDGIAVLLASDGSYIRSRRVPGKVGVVQTGDSRFAMRSGLRVGDPAFKFIDGLGRPSEMVWIPCRGVPKCTDVGIVWEQRGILVRVITSESKPTLETVRRIDTFLIQIFAATK